MTKYALDLTKTHFTQQHGDITVHGSWYGEQQKPCLVLVPSFRMGFEKVTPCIVPLESAWAWSEEEGEPRHTVQMALQFASCLGLDGFNRFTLMRILTIVRDHLGDLMKIPPKPHDFAVVADAFRTDRDGRVHHIEIKEAQ